MFRQSLDSRERIFFRRKGLIQKMLFAVDHFDDEVISVWIGAADFVGHAVCTITGLVFSRIYSNASYGITKRPSCVSGALHVHHPCLA